jgi:hypothetical protein
LQNNAKMIDPRIASVLDLDLVCLRLLRHGPLAPILQRFDRVLCSEKRGLGELAMELDAI